MEQLLDVSSMFAAVKLFIVNIHNILCSCTLELLLALQIPHQYLHQSNGTSTDYDLRFGSFQN